MSEKMICTSECEECTNCILDDSNKAKIKIHCNFKNKDFYFGQMIPCDNKSVVKEGGD